MSMFGVIVELGDKLSDLCREHSQWSQATFGSDSERGPAGPLKHLKKECDEALANPSDKTEYADLFILVLDASRRAGIKPMQLIELAQAKLEVNKKRAWPAGNADEAVEHIR